MKINMLFLFTVLYFIKGFSQETDTVQEEIWEIVNPMPIFSKECFEQKSSDQQQQCTQMEIFKYVSSVNYPQLALDAEHQGKVFISFIVDSAANIVDVMLNKSSGYDILDSTALDYVLNMPSFYSPGYLREKPVSVEYNIPIIFKLEIHKKKKRKKNGIKKTK